MNKRLKELRVAYGLSQVEFSTRMGVPQSTYARWESGTTEPGGAAVALICKTYSCDETWLRTGEGDMFPPTNAGEELAAWFGEVLGGSASEEDFLLLDTIRRIPAEARRDFVRAFQAAMEDYEKKNNPTE